MYRVTLTTTDVVTYDVMSLAQEDSAPRCIHLFIKSNGVRNKDFDPFGFSPKRDPAPPKWATLDKSTLVSQWYSLDTLLSAFRNEATHKDLPANSEIMLTIFIPTPDSVITAQTAWIPTHLLRTALYQ